MHRIALKLVSVFLILFGVVFVAALFHPETAEHLNPRVPLLAITLTIALTLVAAGVGLWSMKRWGLYLFLIQFLVGVLYNLVALGTAHVGNAWIGLVVVVVVVVAVLNWRALT
jgi:hypothetical protein